MCADLLVAGSGYLATQLAHLQASQGERVWRWDPTCRRVQSLASDRRPQIVPTRFDSWVYAVAPAAPGPTALRRAYIDGLLELTESLHPPRQLIYASSVVVYGQRDGLSVDELSPALASDVVGSVVRHGEQSACGVEAEVIRLRFGILYGDAEDSLLRDVGAGLTRRVAGATRWLNLIHRDDAVRALRFMMALRRPEEIYNVVDREAVGLNELIEWLAARVDIEAPAKTGGPAAPSNKRVSGARLREAGFELGYPTYREGYARLLGARP